MKGFLRNFLINLFTLWLASKAVLGFKLENGWQTHLLGSLTLTLILIFLRPLLKLLFLPINFLTLGFFSWITNVIILYLLTIFIPKITVSPFEFPGFSYQGLIIPSIYFRTFESFVVTSFVISIINNLLSWLYR
ncbi:phage holin family protein [Candidatus Microgenomates bacterium]|nr:phage holin family protein [Candidatus Microgenomates bacterium]